MFNSILKKSPSKLALALQLVTVLLYFPIYKLHAIAGFLYASFFVVAGFVALKRALYLHSTDSNISYLFITIIVDGLAIIFAFANAYEIFGTVKNLGNDICGLWEHVYFSTVTFTTLGYGDYLPYGYNKLIAAIEALLGFGYFAFIIGVAGSIFYARINKT